MGMRIRGAQKAVNGVGRLKKRIEEAAQEGVDEGVDLVYAQSQIEVPKDTGALQATGQKVNKSRTGPRRSGAVRYGEPGEGEGIIDYAAAVHEILKASHAAPTKAKFVEDPLVQNVPGTKKATAAAAKKAVRRSFR